MSECFVFLLLTFIFHTSLHVARAIHQSQCRVFTSLTTWLFFIPSLPKKVIVATKMEKKYPLPLINK